MTEDEYYEIHSLVETIEDLSYHSEKFKGYKNKLGNRDDYKKLLKAEELIDEVHESLYKAMKEYEEKLK